MARFTKIGYVAFNVTDIDRSRAFYQDMVGLQLTATGAGGEVYFRCSGDHHNFVLYPSDKRGLARVGFELESEEELDRALEAVTRAGVNVDEVSATECASLHQGPSFRFTEPYTGAQFEFYSAMFNFDGDPFIPTVANIQRLGHIGLGTPDSQKAVDFMTRVLGFKVSDRVGSRTTFMRCFPNPFHHSIALVHSARRMFHHLNFMVTEIDDIGRGLWRLNRNQVPVVYGPGRHVASGSVFLYWSDPDGMTVEYSYGMEQFPESGPRKPRVLEPMPLNSDCWGGPRSKASGVPIDTDKEEVTQQ